MKKMELSLAYLKPSLAAQRLAEQAALEEIKGEQSNHTLKQSYINLMDQLEIDGFPIHEISMIGRKIILENKIKKLKPLGIPEEEITVGTWWFEVARERGCTNPEYARHVKEGDVDTEPHQENSSINTPHAKENKFLIETIQETMKFFDEALAKLKNQPLVSLLEGQVKKSFEHSIHDWEAHLNIAKEIFNQKDKVPANTIHLLLYCLATESSLNHGTVAFFEKYKKVLTLTSKQATKYQKGKVTNMLPIFKPHSRDTAIFLNYYGMPCEKCDSWCVAAETDKGAKTYLKCYDCEHVFEGKTVAKCRFCQIPLYKEGLQAIINHQNCCPNCNSELELPAELVQYAIN